MTSHSLKILRPVVAFEIAVLENGRGLWGVEKVPRLVLPRLVRRLSTIGVSDLAATCAWVGCSADRVMPAACPHRFRAPPESRCIAA